MIYLKLFEDYIHRWKLFSEKEVKPYYIYKSHNACGSDLFSYQDAIDKLSELRSVDFKEMPNKLTILKAENNNPDAIKNDRYMVVELENPAKYIEEFI